MADDNNNQRISDEVEIKVFGFIPLKYNIYRWAVCFTVMLVLIPMAGTMTSFGAIKSAITTTQECAPPPQSRIAGQESRFAYEEAKVTDLCECEYGVQNITEWKAMGYEEVDSTVLSFVGSLVFGFTVGSSFITSPIIKKYGYRRMGLVGVTTGILALLATMATTNFYWWFITYSFAFGVSNNLLYNTGMQMCNAFFPTQYNTAATVIASFGISLGTMVMNPLSVWLTDSFGWRYRFMACAAILAVLGYPMCLFWSQPLGAEETSEEKCSDKGPHEEELIEKSEMKEKKEKSVHPADNMNLFTSMVFWCWLVGTTFWSLDFVIPLDFAISFMTANGISRSAAGSVMGAYGISELVSRALCAITGEQKVLSKPMIYIIFSAIGAAGFALPIFGYNSMVAAEPVVGAVGSTVATVVANVTSVADGVSVMAGCDTPAGEEVVGGLVMSVSVMYVFAIVVGFCAGVLNCLIMACTVDIFGQKRTVEVWNYVNLMLGVGFVGGPPIGAWFTGSVVDGQLVYVFYLGIGFFAACSLIMAPIPCLMKSLQPTTEVQMDDINANNNNREDHALVEHEKK